MMERHQESISPSTHHEGKKNVISYEGTGEDIIGFCRLLSMIITFYMIYVVVCIFVLLSYKKDVGELTNELFDWNDFSSNAGSW